MYISIVMGKSKKHTNDIEVNGFRNMGEAANIVGKRMTTQQTVKSKKTYPERKNIRKI